VGEEGRVGVGEVGGTTPPPDTLSQRKLVQ
jgi:hypothetical protein